MAKPGELYDCVGCPIYPGDLLRTPHYTDFRGKTRYLFHVAVYEKQTMYMVPVFYLEPTMAETGGKCQLVYIAKTCRVIDGTGPGDCLDYRDRPRKAPPTKDILGD